MVVTWSKIVMVWKRYKTIDTHPRNICIIQYRDNHKDLTLNQIGKEFGLSRQRIYQILVSAKGTKYDNKEG